MVLYLPVRPSVATAISAAASGVPVGSMVVGFVAAYLSGLFACRFMIEMVKRAKLSWFALYCAVAGAVAIVYSVI